jgi:hypothetical protein
LSGPKLAIDKKEKLWYYYYKEKERVKNKNKKNNKKVLTKFQK